MSYTVSFLLYILVAWWSGLWFPGAKLIVEFIKEMKDKPRVVPTEEKKTKQHEEWVGDLRGFLMGFVLIDILAGAALICYHYNV